MYICIYHSPLWHCVPRSILCTILDQALSPSYDLAPFPSPPPVNKFLSFSAFLCVAGRDYWWESGGGGGSQIRWRESLVLCTTLNTLCVILMYSANLFKYFFRARNQFFETRIRCFCQARKERGLAGCRICRLSCIRYVGGGRHFWPLFDFLIGGGRRKKYKFWLPS